MDASLRQKLDDLLPYVKPGCIVDKGCGTGKLLVELSRLYPSSSLVGVELSREFLRLCDENTYASEDVALVYGNIIDRNVPEGSATTVIFSSVTHEIYSYSGYSHAELARAMRNAASELAPGGHVLMRDGVSPGDATWRMRFLDSQTRDTFERFAREFKHGAGAPHERLSGGEVRLQAHYANEFLCKKDYLKNWHIEVHEEYGALTLDRWRALLNEVGLEPVEVRGYVNGWIAKNRYEGHVELLSDTGEPLGWPATNCVVVGRKP
jgi:SAM-dependent methyltransferase